MTAWAGPAHWYILTVTWDYGVARTGLELTLRDAV
jgi:hypothetical protein